MIYRYLLRNLPRSPDEPAATEPEPSPEPTAASAALAEMSDFLFDAPASSEPEPAAPTEPAQERSAPAQAEGGVKPSAAPAAPATPPPSTPEPQPKPDAQAELIRQLTAERDRLLAAQPKPEPAAAPQDPDQVFAQEAYWKGGMIPPKVLAALNSDEPEERGMALNGLAAAVLTRAALDSRKFVREALAELRGEVPHLASSTVRTETEGERIKTEFYTAHPMLNKPALHGLVAQAMQVAAQSMAARGQTPAWGETLREDAARLVYEAVGLTPTPASAPAAPPPPARPQAGRAPAAAPFMSGGGGRPPPPISDQFQDILSGF